MEASPSTNAEEQLQSLYSSCQGGTTGRLSHTGLHQLCSKLHLGDAADTLVKQLQAQRHELGLSANNDDEVLEDITFDEFREALVCLLSQKADLSCASFIAPGDKMSAKNTADNKMAKQTSPIVLVSQPLEELEERLSTSGISLDSQPPSLSYSGDNEEEYLRATWQRLGVGHDGYLSLEELATVCHAIGMEKVANEVLEQLFSRLDVDGDGRISFEEFVHMFQNGGPSGNTSLVLDESLHQEGAGAALSRMSSVGDDRRGISGHESGVFSSIDPDNTGYASIETVLELLESLNISNGKALLGELGFPVHRKDRVNLTELSHALEEDLQLPDDQSGAAPVTPTQMVVITYFHEIKCLRLLLETARGERNKLRCDLNEANQRVALLAQELDEHNAHMEASSQHRIQELERQYREQARELQEAMKRERDMARDQVSQVTREMHSHTTQLHQEENKLKTQLSSLQADIKRLEKENSEMSEKLQEAEKQMCQMEKQVTEMQELRSKVAEYESMSPRDEDYRRVVERLERVAAENQQLRDNNDELLAQLDAFPARHTHRNNEKDSSLDGSCLGDYVEAPLGLVAPVKRRGSNSGSGDDSCDEESPRGGKVRRFSKGINVHYVDVGSYDESFFDTSMSNLMKAPPSCVGGGVESQPPSQPPSLDELTARQHAIADGSSGGHVMASMQTVTQLVNKELKQELECELAALREERDRLALQLSTQREEFAHQLEKKEFECEAAVTECTSVREQLEKTASHLNLSLPESLTAAIPRSSSTPVKGPAPTSLRDKCTRCGDTQGQLTMALEELEMALKREEQERSQRLNVEMMLSNKHDGGSTSESVVTDSTQYPASSTEPGSTRAEGADGEGRVRVLEEQCRGLEGELARVRVEVLKMVEERDQLLHQKEELEQRKDNLAINNMKSRCQALIEKIKRKRIVNTPKVKDHFEKHEVESTSEEGKGMECHVEGDGKGMELREEFDGKDMDSLDAVDRPESHTLDHFDSLEKQVCSLEEELSTERDVLEKQKAALVEKNNKLEQDIEILRVEFDKSEDYWTLKLQEEQDYYEEERRLYDEKFSSLEKKIREYEDLVVSGGGGGRDNSEESDRLSTIDESVVWEKQVTELEEEVLLLKKQVDELREERHNVECGWEARVEEERHLANQRCTDLQEQVCGLNNQLQQAQLQVNTVLEELDKVRRESEQRIKELSSQHKMLLESHGPLVNGHSIEMEVSSEDERQFHGSGSNGEETINGSLRAQLRQCQGRLRYLEAALRQHHTHAHHILRVTREQHAAEVQNLESMMAATQQMLGQHIAKYKDQLSKASRSDSLVRELYLENAQLMRALQVTESRQKSAEEAGRRLQVASLGSHSMS